MKVSLSAHGGLAAPMHLGRPPAVVDTENLGPAEARELSDLVAAVTATAAAATPEPSGRARDAMSYTITVEDAGTGAPVVLRSSDTTLTPAFDDLLGWLQSHAAVG